MYLHNSAQSLMWPPSVCIAFRWLCRGSVPGASCHFTLSGALLHHSSLCVLHFLGRNLKICKPGQQRERKPETDSEAASAAEGYGVYSPWSSLRPSAGRPCSDMSSPVPCPVCTQPPWEGCRKDVRMLSLPLDPVENEQ